MPVQVVKCSCMRHPGTLRFASTAVAVKPEADDTGAGGDPEPAFVAEWTPTSEGTTAVGTLRLDLRCDVMELLQSKTNSQLKLGLSWDRVQQGSLGPLQGLSNVSHVLFAFANDDSRAAFVASIQEHRLSATDAAALRRAAATAAGEDIKIDVKPQPQPPRFAGSGVGRRAADTGDVVMQTAEERLLERQWIVHDAELRQLHAALVQDGLMTDAEFAMVHAEEKADFFSSDASRQRVGMSGINDALGALVDPKTGELLPVTEHVAATVFRQSPSLARIYRARVQTPEDELVFWDAVVRRALFLSRTFLDEHQTANPAAPMAAQSTTTTTDPAAVVGATWNARARRGLPPDTNVDEPATPPVAPDAGTRVPKPYSFDGEIRLKESRDALLAHGTLDDLAAKKLNLGQPDSIHNRLAQLQKARAPLTLNERLGVHLGGAAARDQLPQEALRQGVDASRRTAGFGEHGGGLWGSVLLAYPTVTAFDYALPSSGEQHHHHLHNKRAVPSELRTYASLQRLFWRHALQLRTSAPAQRDAIKLRCRDVATAMRKALSKALASGDTDDRDGENVAWNIALREAEATLARAEAVLTEL